MMRGERRRPRPRCAKQKRVLPKGTKGEHANVKREKKSDEEGCHMRGKTPLISSSSDHALGGRQEVKRGESKDGMGGKKIMGDAKGTA